jgi:hypothetical protein
MEDSKTNFNVFQTNLAVYLKATHTEFTLLSEESAWSDIVAVAVVVS